MYAMQSSKWDFDTSRGQNHGTISRDGIRIALAAMKSFLLTCGVFCGGYVTNTTLDTALEAAESYFHVQPAVYIDSNGYVICSPEKPKITLAADGN
jgi:hypothetical protein